VNDTKTVTNVFATVEASKDPTCAEHSRFRLTLKVAEVLAYILIGAPSSVRLPSRVIQPEWVQIVGIVSTVCHFFPPAASSP
jgi:hypothetical protein